MHDQVSLMFKALSDSSRMKIFHSLMIISTSLSISQITEKFNMTRQGVTKHIKILEKAELINITSVGRERFCAANPQPLNELKSWLSFYDKFWDDKLDGLSSYLNEGE